MSKKRLIRHRPNQGDLGIYTFKDENQDTDYFDSDSLPLRYDKFEGKDLVSISQGYEDNESILDSYIQELNQEGDASTGDYTRLKYTGTNFLEINSVQINNRGVNTRINDVYFRFYIFSEEYYNPNGQSNASDFLTKVHGTQNGKNIPSNFYYQSGPNYGENGSPGTGLFQDIRVLEDFGVQNRPIVDDSEGYIPLGDNPDEQIVDAPQILVGESNRSRGDFDPKQTMLIKTFDGEGNLLGSQSNPYVPPTNQTTIFQEDGTPNPIYIALFMDGDMNPKRGPDRSRNETLNIWSFSPEQVFDVQPDGQYIGKETVLEWDDAEIELFNYSAEKTAAFSATKLKITINTLQGVELGFEGYNPPPEYLGSENNNPIQLIDVTPPIAAFNLNEINNVILNMLPTRELLKTASLRNYGVNDIHSRYQQIHNREFSDYIPIPYVELLSDDFDTRDFSIYYEDRNDRVLTSAPNVVDLSFNISLHPEPYPLGHPYYLNLYPYNTTDDWDEAFTNIELIDRWDETQSEYTITYDDGNITQYDINNENEVDYMFFVIDWNDIDNKYKTIGDALADWPESPDELLGRQIENLFKPQFIDKKTYSGLKNSLKNNYTTPGMKRIKTIMVSHRTEAGAGKIEPLRWKLITTKIFLDIPTSEFPDFGELGGNDYITIPWPYTTPVIGGISENSKYSKSVDEILGGGKIGDLDVIDETFLIQTRENDELGKNIESMDLEQVRFFNTSYDMNRLLQIPTSPYQVIDTSSDYLKDLEFPTFFEEFDDVYSQDYSLIENIVSPSETDLQNNFNEDDINYWLSRGRPDISEWIRINLNCQINGCIKLDSDGGTHPGNDYHRLPVELFHSPYWEVYKNNRHSLFHREYQPNDDISDDNISWACFGNLSDPSRADGCNPIWPPHSGLPTIDTLFANNPVDDLVFNPLGMPPSLSDDNMNEVMDGWGNGGGEFDPSTGEGLGPPGGNLSPDVYQSEGGSFNGLQCNPPAEVSQIGSLGSFSWTNYWWFEGTPSGDGFCFHAYQTMGFANPEHYRCNGTRCIKDMDYYYEGSSLSGPDDYIEMWEDYLFSNPDYLYNPDIHRGHPSDIINFYFTDSDGSEITNAHYGLDSDLLYTTRRKLDAQSVPKLQKFYGDIMNIEFTNETQFDLNKYYQSIQDPVPSLFGLWTGGFPYGTAPSVSYGPNGLSGAQLGAGGFPQTLWGYINLYRIMSSLDRERRFYDMHDDNWQNSYTPYTANLYESNAYVDGGLLGTGPMMEHLVGEIEQLHSGDEYLNVITEALMSWAHSNFGRPLPIADDTPIAEISPVIIDGCDDRIPINSLFINSNGEVLFKFETEIHGIQFNIDNNYSILDIINDGRAQEENWAVTFYQNQIVSFRQPTSDSNPLLQSDDQDNNCGKLFTLLFSPDNGISEWAPTQANINQIVVAPNPLLPDAVQTGLSNSMTHFKPISGCDDPNADNYDENVTIGYGPSWGGSPPNVCTFPPLRGIANFLNTTETEKINYPYRYDDENYWDGSLPNKTFPEESSVGQIFITDNQDLLLSENCKLEFNAGQMEGKSVYDSSGNANKGLLIGDYKIKKNEKNQPMRRDSFIKLPKKAKNKNGAL